MGLRGLAIVAVALLAGALGCGTAAVRRTGTPRAAARTRAGAHRRRSPAARRVPASVVLHGPRRRRWVALTFDADMTPAMARAIAPGGRRMSWVDARLLRELRTTHTPATLFLTGLWARRNARLVRRLAADPRIELENHSYDHAAWQPGCFGLPTVRGPRAKRREVLRVQRIVARLAGVRPRFFRFPGTCHDAADVRLVARLGLRPVDGDVVSGDAFNSDVAAVVAQVLHEVRPGSIVIAHLDGAPNAPATAAAMARIVPALRARHYRLVTVAELLSGPVSSR